MLIDGVQRRAVWWRGDEAAGRVAMIDQRLVPHRVEVVEADTVEAVAAHIRDMTVRGAPTIGATAAYGMVLGRDGPAEAAAILEAARPTARDLFAATAYMRDAPTLARAEAFVDDIVARCRRIGVHGQALLARLAARRGARDLRVLTHCHAGALAAVDHGTALAPLHESLRLGAPGLFVWVDETRPRLQGAITAWELQQAGIAHRVIVDNAGAALMARGEVDVVIVGADRIVQNGDVANKIGTYQKALAAAAHGIPFYVAAPRSTFDPDTPTGADIVLETRDEAEVLRLGAAPLYGPGTAATNLAFDVTPARLVTGYITEDGVLDAAGLAGWDHAVDAPVAPRRGI